MATFDTAILQVEQIYKLTFVVNGYPASGHFFWGGGSAVAKGSKSEGMLYAHH